MGYQTHHSMPNPLTRLLILKVIGLVFIIYPQVSLAQNAYISGTVNDSASMHSLPGVNVIVDSVEGFSTDSKGHYDINLEPGEHIIAFSFVGFKTVHRTIDIRNKEKLVLDILLAPLPVELDMTVITASRYEQKLSDASVSIGVMKPAFIQSINTLSFDRTLDYMPGVDILDGQASIRGGSGYSYGTGSRVLVLVDDLPLLTASDGDVKWNYLPVENIAQVEVLKGASSALYGSSALNGIINIRTAYPGVEPQTNVTVFNGFYNKPIRKELAWWWDTYPVFNGFSFSHLRKIKNVDIVVGGNGLIDQGYRSDNYDERVRFDFKIRHVPDKVKGLSYGVNSSIQWQHKSDFFIWENADSGAFVQNPEVVTPNNGIRFNLDPWVAYFDKHQNKHALKMRYFRVTNNFAENPDKNNASDLYYGEYQFNRAFNEKFHFTAGFSGLAGNTKAQLYGDHYNTDISLFTQLDYKFFNRLSLSIGGRWERYTLDSSDEESGFVLRAGANCQVARATFIRASFGQGYRFPSIAEKYTATSLGSINIFPNPDLKSERGWSSELGLKQGFIISNWSGFFDAAVFWTEYENMIEFTFGVYSPDTTNPTLDDVGFKSLNIGKARINGFEIGITGNGKMGKIPLNLFIGYTYMNPVDLSSDTLSNDILKYRYRHSLKGDISIDIRKFTMGVSIIYRSFMERIDQAFEEQILGQEIFPGLKEYRQNNDHGNWVFDLRMSYLITSSTKVSLIAKNIFNMEYMGRPGDIQPPRNITLQAVIKL
jgi:outer membrane cobalamin receptor